MPIATYIVLLTAVLLAGALTAVVLTATSFPLALILPAGLAATALAAVLARRR